MLWHIVLKVLDQCVEVWFLSIWSHDKVDEQR